MKIRDVVWDCGKLEIIATVNGHNPGLYGRFTLDYLRRARSYPGIRWTGEQPAISGGGVATPILELERITKAQRLVKDGYYDLPSEEIPANWQLSIFPDWELNPVRVAKT